MKFFEANGYWFASEDASNPVSGTLRFSESGISLTLVGSLQDAWSMGAVTYPILHGVVGSSPYGAYVTLIGAYRVKLTTNMPGITSEVIHANQAILGTDYVEGERSPFHSIILQLSYLDIWYGRSGLSMAVVKEDGRRTSLIHDEIKPDEFSLDGGILTLSIQSAVNRSSHRSSIEETAAIKFQPPSKGPWPDLVASLVRPIQDLLSFASDTPNAVDDIQFLGEQDERFDFEHKKTYNLIYNPIFRLKEKKALTHHTMLFTLADAQAAGLNIFQNWFDFSRKHRNFCLLYFATLYAQPKYLDLKFSSLISAFSLLNSSLSEASENAKSLTSEVASLLANRFGEDEIALIGHALPTASELEMPLRMLGLLEEHAPLMRHVIEEDFSQFVLAVSSTLYYIERRDVPAGRPFFKGEAMHRAMEAIRLLIKIVVLKELGFDAARVDALIHQYLQFNPAQRPAKSSI